MSDIAPVPDPGGAPVEPTAAAVAPPPAPVPDADFPEIPTDQAVFDAAYVRSIREKGASYRTAAREAQERLAAYSIFDQYEPEDRQVFIDMADAWRRNPTEAAAMMQQIVEAVMPPSPSSQSDPQQQPAAASTPPPVPSNLLDEDTGEVSVDAIRALVQGELAGFRNEQVEAARQAEMEHLIAGWHAEMRSEGFEPSTPAGRYILQMGAEAGGDLQRGIAAYREMRQAAIDEYVSGKANGAGGVIPTPNGAPANEVPHEPKTFKEAAEMARAYVASLSDNT